MKSLRFLLAVAALFVICEMVRGQDSGSSLRGALGSGSNLGQVLTDKTLPTTGNSPFTSGLGQMVNGWGSQGQDSAPQIPWLQRMRTDEMATRTRWMEQPRSAREERFRDIREDRRELRNDERRLGDDQRRLSRDREDLRRDLRDDRFRDIREDRHELRDGSAARGTRPTGPAPRRWRARAGPR